jgi:DNA-binding MarR family transcriptional regulator
MLANIAKHPGITVTKLAEILVMDQTTVTRNIQSLLKKGYALLEPVPFDQRVRSVAVSQIGLEKLEKAKPLWQQAQAEEVKKLGQLGFDALLRSLHSVIE